VSGQHRAPAGAARLAELYAPDEIEDLLRVAVATVHEPDDLSEAQWALVRRGYQALAAEPDSSLLYDDGPPVPARPVVGTGPAETGALAALRLRAYTDREPEDVTDYVVVDLHGVSIGVKRRSRDLYLHVDTSETPDEVVAVEINGGGEIDYPVR